MEFPLHRFRAMADLSEAEAKALRSLGDSPVQHPRRTTLQREGEPVRGAHLMLEGWVLSSVILSSGKRLVQKVHLPGDMLSTPSMAVGVSIDTLTTISDVTTSFVPFKRIGELYASHPRLAALFTIAIQMERLSLMDTLAATGAASSVERLARFLLDVHARLSACGAVKHDAFELPLTQEVIGDLLGMTSVHANRSLQELSHRGLISREGYRMQLIDIDGLSGLSPLHQRRPMFQPEWLPPSAGHASVQ